MSEEYRNALMGLSDQFRSQLTLCVKVVFDEIDKLMNTGSGSERQNGNLATRVHGTMHDGKEQHCSIACQGNSAGQVSSHDGDQKDNEIQNASVPMCDNANHLTDQIGSHVDGDRPMCVSNGDSDDDDVIIIEDDEEVANFPVAPSGNQLPVLNDDEDVILLSSPSDSDSELRSGKEAEAQRVVDLTAPWNNGIATSGCVQGITNFSVAIFSETTTAALNAAPAYCHPGKRKRVSCANPSAAEPNGCRNFASPPTECTEPQSPYLPPLPLILDLQAKGLVGDDGDCTVQLIWSVSNLRTCTSIDRYSVLMCWSPTHEQLLRTQGSRRNQVSDQWELLSTINATLPPILVTYGNFVHKGHYKFAVFAIDNLQRSGSYSNIAVLDLL